MVKKSLFILMALLATNLFISAHAEIVEDGLVSYWSFDKSNISGKKAIDGTGAHNGEIKGTLKSVPGKIGEALEFDGDQNNYVLIDGATDFDLKGTDFTWMAWIKTGESKGVIFAKTGPRGADDQGPKTWWLCDGVQCFDVGWVGNKRDTEQVNDNKWHHVAVAVAKAGTEIQYFVDGKATSKQPMLFADKPDEWKETLVQIGIDGRVDGEFGYFNGLIDEVAVYDRFLDEGDVNTNFKSDKGLSVEAAGRLAMTWGSLKAR
jgi:hypothetical protein